MFCQHSTPYTTCTSPIMHHIYPPKFYITFVFYFSLVLHFGGQIICVVGDVQAEYEIDFFPRGLQDIFFWVQPPPTRLYHVHVSYYWFRAGCQAGWVSRLSYPSPWFAKYQKSWKGLHYLGSGLPFLRISTLCLQHPENQLNRLLLIFSILY